ncbi:GNAT family N-acetyltransferase [Flavobacterium sp. LB2P44]|uniref:GNAT family N-acetyltransferase n=1 Tax=Flavobacterium sp. LB2P44 TaxID=3401713 RepID=UPI003AB0F9F7
MITREATLEDWEKLLHFFKLIYRENHPLQNKEFWQWQYGDTQYGRSFICINAQEEIVGHVGANFQGGIAWIINVYLKEECRGKGFLGELYGLARAYYPLAATAANDAGLGLYRNMRWIRYYDLVRFVKINPSLLDKSFESVCKKVVVDTGSFIKRDTHYFRQPKIKGLQLSDGSRAVSQEEVGGLRILEIKNVVELEKQAWELGYNWVDYITSWNNIRIKDLDKNNWTIDYKNVVPWRLNPVEENYFCDISFLSEKPLDNEFIVKRNFSDHGRIGSL